MAELWLPWTLGCPEIQDIKICQIFPDKIYCPEILSENGFQILFKAWIFRSNSVLHYNCYVSKFLTSLENSDKISGQSILSWNTVKMSGKFWQIAMSWISGQPEVQTLRSSWYSFLFNTSHVASLSNNWMVASRIGRDLRGRVQWG